MLKYGPVLFLHAALMSACRPPAPVADERPIEVMSFNIMCSFCNAEGFDRWDARMPQVDAALDRGAADLIGLQEPFSGLEVSRFLAEHPGFEAFYYVDPGVSETPFPDYPDATLLVRSERFTVVDTGVFWLSSTPDEPWTFDFAAPQLWRVVAWAELEQVTDGRHLLFVTTHFDNNTPSQELSAPLALERLAPMAQALPLILTGDFNSTPASTAYQILAASLVDTYDIAAERTFIASEDPAPLWDPEQRIDHIFLGGPTAMSADRYTVDLTRYGDPPRFPSDHWPVSATVRW